MRLALNVALGLACAVLVRLAHAGLPPAEVFFKDPDITEAVLSPAGDRLAIATSLGAERIGLAMLDMAAGGKLSRTVQFRDADVRDVHWVNDDRLIFSAVDFSEGSGRPNGAPGLYAINPDGSQMVQLVRRQGRPFVTNGHYVDRALDWNHRLLRVPGPKKGQANEDILVVEFSTDERHIQYPKWLNTRTGRTRPAEFNPPPDPVGWMMDGQGEARVVFTRTKDRQAAYWRAPGKTDWEKLYDGDLLETPFQVNAVDDAGRLYVTHPEGPDGLRVLARYNFERKAPETEAWIVTRGFDFTGSVITELGTGEAKGVRLVADAETTVWLDPALNVFQQDVDQKLPNRVNRISCRRCGQADMVALVRSYSDHDPGSLWLYEARPDADGKHWRAIGPVMSGIAPEQMASMQLERIAARDGRDLPVWITRPDGATGPLPAVVLVHGGPWVRGSRWGWHAYPQFLASRGYVVIEPEMRGSAGYGLAHLKAGFKQFGQAMQNDVADALKWAQQRVLASEKACIAGASYGGYSTLMGLVKDPQLYRCGVAWMALTDLDLYLSGSWWVSDDISSVGRKYTLPEMVGDATKDAAMIEANSPVNQAARIKAPVLLAFGEADMRVPLAHGKRMRDALRDAGNPPEWATYPGEGHGFALLKSRLDFAQRMEAFLAKHLGRDSHSPEEATTAQQAPR
jgi:dipeptidyl aminopeptidase/acylaminoacyl peptidase